MKRKSFLKNGCMKLYPYTFGLSKRVLQTLALMILFVPSLLAVDVPLPQSTEIKGTVTDKKTGETIIGATIQVKGTTTGVATDFDGAFSIKADASKILVVSYIGYTTKEVTVGTNKVLNIQLEEDTKALDEVVVIGYGVQRRANLTGSVGSVKGSDIENRPVANVSAMIAGLIPGVTAVQTSGAPGGQSAGITIRGKNSIHAGSPLVIVDGAPSSVATMNSIDIADIESLNILKDAASSAIYGVQAANGVILITTKKGQKGTTQVRYSGSVSIVAPTTHYDWLGSYDYALLYNEAQLNDNPKLATPKFSAEALESYRNGTGTDTDWYAETFKKVAMETYHNVSISGGSEKTTYNASIGYTFQDGLGYEDYNRFNIRTNIESEINHWLTTGINLSAFRGISEGAQNNFGTLMLAANRLTPTMPVYAPDGSFYGEYTNPVAETKEMSGWKTTTDQQINAIIHATINILPELSVKGLFNVKNDTKDYEEFKKSYSYGGSPDGGSLITSGDRFAKREDKDYNNYTAQLLMNYNKTFGKHDLLGLAGFEQTEYNYKHFQATRQGGGSNDLDESLTTLDPASQKNLGGGHSTARRSYFGRVQYGFDNKYLLEVNIRADASSRFAKDHRWGYFPSISGAWRITEEDFFKGSSTSSWISNLKLRGGYGKTGHEEVSSVTGNFPTIPSYAYETDGNMLFGSGTIYPTIKEARYVNSEVTWAEITSYEVGLEAAFLDNKIGFDLTVYNKLTNGMLLDLPVSTILGMPAPAQNAGEVKNTGFDLNIFHNNQVTADFRYDVSLNLAYVKNEILSLKGTEGPASDAKFWYLEGESTGTYYGYHANGFFNTQDDLDNLPTRTGRERLGDIKYHDLNKDGKIDSEDRAPMGNNFPAWTAGLSVGLQYKNFDMSMLFQGAFDVDHYYTEESAYSFFNGGKVMERHLDRWTPDNHDATYPILAINSALSSQNYEVSTFWLQDASYVRLKNITLGYNLPVVFAKKIGIQNARFYVSGENLFTFTGLTEGLDPENGASRGHYSPVKKGSLGVRVTF